MMYKPDDENLEQANDTETLIENDSTEPEAPIDPPIEEEAETPVEDQE